MNRPAPGAPAAEWLVYGDALQEAGNFRGELIGLAHAVWLLAHRGLFPGLRRLVVERTRLTGADAPRYRYVVGQE